MKLYEIDSAILDLMDEETGEIKDFEEFEKLQMAREDKIESLCLWVKELQAESTAIKTEIENLDKRRKSADKKVESLKQYIAYVLNGEKFKTARAVVGYTKSTRVNIADKDIESFILWAQQNDDSLLHYEEPKLDKAAIKDALKIGMTMPYVSLETNNNISIK